MKRLNPKEIEGATVSENVLIECDEFINEGKFFIGDNVSIKAERIYLGNNAQIERDTKIDSLAGIMESFYMGDESLIGFNSQVLVPEFFIGDYTHIFNSSLCSGYKPITIGHNGWIGQFSILNSAETLSIGNNVRMGGNAQIWTHVASGELLEGCVFNSEKPVTIEDNVWLMGFGHTISPGVILKRNSIIMSGSVVSKSTEPFHTYSGIPAKDVTDSLPGWQKLSQDEKFEMLIKFVNEFKASNPEYKNMLHCLDMGKDSDVKKMPNILAGSEPNLIFIKEIGDLNTLKDLPHSFFDLASKYYIKRRTDIEVRWMKFSTGYRARFIPLN